MKLKESMSKRSFNLQITRFVAAIFVILAHAYILCTGTNEGDWFIRITKGQITMGYAAVAVFFFCGGLLIAKSVERFEKAAPFFKARVLKIFPPLIFVVFLTIILGSFVTTLSLKEYWENSGTWKYLLNGVLVLQHNLPGVFEHAPYISTVNGALWTLPVEFLCYVGCFIVYKLGMLKKQKFFLTVPAVVLFVVGVNTLGGGIPILQSMVSPCLFFYVGMACYVYREHIVLKWNYAFLAMGLLCLASILGILVEAMYLLFPYILLVFWYSGKQIPDYLADVGNISYGMYLWGYPVQQFLILCFQNKMDPMKNAFLTIPVTILLGVLTFYLTEKPLMKEQKRMDMVKR